MALITGPSNADGCNLYRNDSTGTKGGGEAGQPKAFTTPGRQEMTKPKGMMDCVGREYAKKQAEREIGEHLVADYQNKQHPSQKKKARDSRSLSHRLAQTRGWNPQPVCGLSYAHSVRRVWSLIRNQPVPGKHRAPAVIQDYSHQWTAALTACLPARLILHTHQPLTGQIWATADPEKHQLNLSSGQTRTGKKTEAPRRCNGTGNCRHPR